MCAEGRTAVTGHGKPGMRGFRWRGVEGCFVGMKVVTQVTSLSY